MLSFPTTLRSLLPKVLFPIFCTSLTGLPRTFLYLIQPLHMFCFSYFKLPFISNVVKGSIFNKLLFSPVQSISLKSQSSSLLSVNTLFVTFSCKIYHSVFLRGSLLPSSNWFISFATLFSITWTTPSYFSLLERSLNFFYFFGRLFSSLFFKLFTFCASGCCMILMYDIYHIHVSYIYDTFVIH